MNLCFDPKAPKKPTNVSVNSDLLAKSKELKINLSATLERALSEIVTSNQRDLWKLQNTNAIQAYNHLIETNGAFSDDLRKF